MGIKKLEVKKFSISTLFLYVIMLLFLFIIIVPVLYAFVSSFKSTAEILQGGKFLPKSWKFNNYETAWVNANFATYTFNSLWYSALTVIITLVNSSLLGYVFARAEFPGRNLMFGILTGLMFVVLGTSTMYPTLQILRALHLSDSLWGLIVKLFFTANITNVFLVRSYIVSLPKELDEAAIIDGCSFLKTFFCIILPLLKPVMATVGILSFQSAWGDYLWPMIVTISNPARRPLSVGLVALKGSSDAAASWNIIMAGAIISSIPIIIVYLFCNKYFVKGITSGAIKG